ncbi:MAG: PilZ domain-containing protein [Chromatiaceae bacterium]|nr:PilZ domain-containing protein [Chromatiaceae bacterium]
MTHSFDRSDERRLHARYRVDLEAEIEPAPGVSMHAQIRDLCSGGLFLTVDAQRLDGHALPGTRFPMGIALPDGGASARVLAEVVRITPQGFGATLCKPVRGCRAPA